MASITIHNLDDETLSRAAERVASAVQQKLLGTSLH